jgi:hypothetical protein
LAKLTKDHTNSLTRELTVEELVTDSIATSRVRVIEDVHKLKIDIG